VRWLLGCLGLSVLLGCGPQVPAPRLAAAATDFRALTAPHVARPHTTNNRIALHADRAAMPALLAMLEGARHSIWIETFELHDDPAGRKILDTLIAKHQAGVAVRVILDEIGNRAVKSSAVKVLEENGVPVLYYGPYPYRGKDGVGLNITHRKLYLVDGDRGMTGGMNLGDKYLEKAHDMLWALEGEAAWALHEEFAAEWSRGGGKPALQVPAAPVGAYGAEAVAIAVTSPRERGREDEIRQVLTRAIDEAKVRVDLAYPFFWDDDLLERLYAAERRGVRVRVVITKHGKAAMTRLNLYSARQGMPRGIEFHWFEAAYAHIKYCAIDDGFLLIGSSNGDTLTFENNQELDLVLSNPATVAAFRRAVSDADWNATSPVTPEDTKLGFVSRPVLGLLEWLDAYL